MQTTASAGEIASALRYLHTNSASAERTQSKHATASIAANDGTGLFDESSCVTLRNLLHVFFLIYECLLMSNLIED